MSPGLVSVLIALLALCGGCFGSTPKQGGVTEMHHARDKELFYRAPAVSGPKDSTNRYLPTLRIIVREKAAREKDRELLNGQMTPSGQCSGVLIAPRLVVTAGHCVCMMRSFTASTPKKRQDETSQRKSAIVKNAALQNETVAAIIDGSECAKSAEIETVVYDMPDSGEEGSRSKLHRGTVQAHPRLELLFNDKGYQVWANADLAVIALERPVKDFPVLKLAASEIRENEPIIMVGYGPGNTLDFYKDRHFGENKVGWIRRLETGSVEFVAAVQYQPDGSPASHLLEGDSGGACLSKADETVLVGIAASRAKNRKGEQLSVFTSIYAHRDWLKQQLDAL